MKIVNEHKIIVNQQERIDKFLSSKLDFSRNKVQELIKKDKILVNDAIINKSNYKLMLNDVITILDENNDEQDLSVKDIIPIKGPLNIIYEDEHLIIIDKSSGVLTHPTIYDEHNTIINYAYHYFLEKGIKDIPWIVHRLDKDTSGLMIIAKSLKALNLMQQIFNKRQITKKYYALVHNCFNETNLTINIPIARSFQNKLKMNAITGKNPKEAITEVEVIKNYHQAALVSCNLLTGRTHQIRVHLRYINHPIINDELYGVDKKITPYKQFLHSYYLSFIHPVTGQKIEIKLNLPKEFNEKINELII